MSDPSPKLITVRLKKGGWEVEVTCAEAQLEAAIKSVLSSLELPALQANPGLQRTEEGTDNKTCRGLISDLWTDGWFSENRSLSDVHEEIARRGYHYDRTAVSHALTDLVRENVLTRQGNPRNYSYIQKRPSQPSSMPKESPQKNHDDAK